MLIAKLIRYAGNRNSGPGSLLVITKETNINSIFMLPGDARECAAATLVGAIQGSLNSPGDSDVHLSIDRLPARVGLIQ